MGRKPGNLATDRKWREVVVAALARLRPVVAKLEEMLTEGRAELGKWEQEERRLTYLDQLGRQPIVRHPGRVNEYQRPRRKPLLIEDKDREE